MTRARHLIVLPHGVLAYLPFAALRDLRRNRHLVEDRSVMMAPSAASLVALRQSAGASRGASGIVALAPFPDQLPGTASELEGIARAVPGMTALSGEAATELAVREAVGGKRILHLATHGLLNPDNPLFSRMELRAAAHPTSEEDGRLEVREVSSWCR